MSDIFDRIQQVIEKENLNASSFSRKIGVSDQAIRNIVGRKRNFPGYEILKAIIQTFEWVDAGWLLTGKKTVAQYNGLTEQAGLTVDSSENSGEASFLKSLLLQHLRDKDHRIETLIEENIQLKHKIKSLKKHGTVSKEISE